MSGNIRVFNKLCVPKHRMLAAVLTVLAAAFAVLVCSAVVLARPVYAEGSHELYIRSGEPVKIGTYEELAAFIGSLNSGELPADTDAVLTGDIDVPDEVGNNWVPLGIDKEHAYSGVFDGAGHKVRDICVDRSTAYPRKWKAGNKVNNYTAFISFLGDKGTVKDLQVNAYIIDINDVAGIVSQNAGTIQDCKFRGYLESNIYPNNDGGTDSHDDEWLFEDYLAESGGIAALSSGTIKGCTVLKGSDIRHGGVHVGGIVGTQVDGGVVSACVNRANVTCYDTKYPTSAVFVGGAGGIVGGQESGYFDREKPVKPVVQDCMNYGTVTCESLAGGIAGQSYGGDILGCTNYGTVDEVTRNWGGGIAGYFTTRFGVPEDAPAELSACSNYGDVNPSSYDEDARTYRGTFIGGIVGSAEDESSSMIESRHDYVKVHDNINYGSVQGKFAVGGVLGKIENARTRDTDETLIYDLVNLGGVTGSDDVGGVIGACPGIAADMVNYGEVTLVVPDIDPDDPDYDPDTTWYFAGGVIGEMAQTGQISTSYNIGAVTACDMDGIKITGDVAEIGGIIGGAVFTDQLPGCYYCAETSGQVQFPVGFWHDYKARALTLEQMGGGAAMTNMPELFDETTSLHKAKAWKTVDNIDIGGVTYYMTPQLADFTAVTLDDILAAGAQASYPVDISDAKVLIADQKYTGKELKPAVEVSLGGIDLGGDDYEIVAPGPYVEPGTYEVEVVASGAKYTGTATGTFTITKAAQKIKSVTPTSKTVKAGKSFKLKTTVTPSGQGKITYKKTSGDKKITVTSKGTVKINKKLKKNKTYKIKVKVTVAETNHYTAAATTKTITIKVK